LILTSEFPPGPGGIGQHAFSLAMGLKNLGNEVTVMTISDYSTVDENKVFDQLNIQLKIMRFNRYLPIFTQISRFWQLLSFIYNPDLTPDCLIASGRFPLIFLALFGKIKKIKKINKIGILHGSEVNPKKFIERILNQSGISKCNKIISVSEFTQSLIPNEIRLKIKNGNFYIIGNGITSEATNGWDVKSGSIDLIGYPKLLTVGNVIPRKGQHLVVEAMPQLLNKFPDIHYHIVGIRRNVDKIDNSIKINNVKDSCTFHGRVVEHSDLALYYREVDLLMLLSENQINGDVEGFGIVALEANYFGIPVIGALGTGVEAAIKDGYSGILVDANNKSAICDAVEKILNNKEFFRIESKKWAINHHWDNISKEFEKVINHY